jgi:hypothetical protein
MPVQPNGSEISTIRLRFFRKTGAKSGSGFSNQSTSPDCRAAVREPMGQLIKAIESELAVAQRLMLVTASFASTGSPLNKTALDRVVYAPLGFYLLHFAWRKNVTGIVPGPLPFFWGVSKTV